MDRHWCRNRTGYSYAASFLTATLIWVSIIGMTAREVLRLLFDWTPRPRMVQTGIGEGRYDIRSIELDNPWRRPVSSA